MFRGDDGLDELTTTGHSRIWEVTRGDIHEHDLDPRDLGIPSPTCPTSSAGLPPTTRTCSGGRSRGAGAVRDIVLLNAAAGIVAFELSQDATQVQRPILERLRDGLARASAAVDDGSALAKLDQWIGVSRELAAPQE